MSTLIAIGAGIAVLTGIGAGIGIGIATAKAADAVARQSEADGKISKILLLGCALAEKAAVMQQADAEVRDMVVTAAARMVAEKNGTSSDRALYDKFLSEAE